MVQKRDGLIHLFYMSFHPFCLFYQVIRLWKVVYLNIQNFVFSPKFFTLYYFSLFLPTIFLYILISFILYKVFVCLKNCLFVWLLFMYWNIDVRAQNHKDTYKKIKIKTNSLLEKFCLYTFYYKQKSFSENIDGNGKTIFFF